ncbi:MAG: hypothetical protein IMW99_04835 [Firmicutes bacterium]|nr:hypothetical protein [Bacillota bacterium]
MQFLDALTAQSFLPALIILAGLSYLQYLWGRRANLSLFQQAAREMERALQPEDQSYTWIGGFVGFRADYVLHHGHLKKAEATLTALPRHSLLYLPLSWAWRHSDSLYLLLRPERPLRGRAHLYRVGPGLPRPRIQNADQLKSERLAVEGRTFELRYESHARKAFLRDLLVAVQAADDPDGSPSSGARALDALQHLSINAEEGALYCRCIPRSQAVEPLVKALVQGLADYCSRRDAV